MITSSTPYWVGDLLVDSWTFACKRPLTALAVAPVCVSALYHGGYYAFAYATSGMPWFSFYQV